MIHVIQQSCLEKILPTARTFKEPYDSASVLVGEEFGYQIVLYSDSEQSERVTFKKKIPLFCKLYLVQSVPVNWPHYKNDSKKDYVVNEPALVPDALIPIDDQKVLLVNQNPTVLWVSVDADFPGDFDLSFVFSTASVERKTKFNLHVLPNKILKSYFTHVEYIDPHSIASAYRVPLYSDVFWDLLYEHFKIAAEYGVDTLVTPLFPAVYNAYFPLKPVQLVRIKKLNSRDFEFNYDLFDSWYCLAKKAGIKNITIPPIFPSFKTLKCLDIEVTEQYRDFKLFEGVDMNAPEYITFMRKYLRRFFKHLKEIEFDGNIEVQISCDPHVEDFELYRQCRMGIFDVIQRHKVADAIVPHSFYALDYASSPTILLREFKDYCHQFVGTMNICFDLHSSADISNLLTALSAVRLRGLGALIARYNIVGMFNLGFNCNYAPVGDGLFETDCENYLPTGSCALVYAGSHGPIPSVRLKLLKYAIQDSCAYEVFENLTNGDVFSAMQDKALHITPESMELTAEQYLAYRERVNRLIERKSKI
jgi:hypothetical protein